MESTIDNKQDIIIAWTVALLVHVLFFSLTGKMFVKPPQFAIAPSREIDINLIDEPHSVIASEAKQSFNSKKIASSLKSAPRNDTDSTTSKDARLKPFDTLKRLVAPKHLLTPKQLITPSGLVKVEAKPDYIQNPPPPYPELARQMRQEGFVMLSVDVNKEGDPVSVEIIQSSGFRMLDQAALKAVRHWKFQPGSIGGITVDSTVAVPIRFRLEK